jgi:hypothetical protein
LPCSGAKSFFLNSTDKAYLTRIEMVMPSLSSPDRTRLTLIKKLAPFQ